MRSLNPLWLVVLTGACGQGAPEAAPDGGATRPPAADSAPAHDMGTMTDSAGSDSSAPAAMDHSGMTGMDHGTAAKGGTPAATGHEGMAGMDHGQAGPSTPAAAGVGHAGHNAQPQTRAGGAVDHAAMGHTPVRGRQARPAAGMDHSRMGHGQPAARPARAAAGMDHGAHQAGARPASPMAGMDHGAQQPGAPANAAGSHAGMQMGRPAGAAASSPGDEKLLNLAAELLRDPQVQARVQADTALRRRWQDPEVRRVITSQGP